MKLNKKDVVHEAIILVLLLLAVITGFAAARLMLIYLS